MTTHRSLSEIAHEISRSWRIPHFAAIPYLRAMGGLGSIHDFYGFDSGRSIVLYFLNNAGTWRGEDAKRLKAELKSMLK